MVGLTALTAIIIFCGQKMILSHGKVKRDPYLQNDDDDDDDDSDDLHAHKNNATKSNKKKSCCGCNGKDTIEGFQGFPDSYQYLNKNISKTISKIPKNITEIINESLMGPYDGKCLAGNDEDKAKYKWMKTPATTPLLSETGFIVQGSQAPLKNRLSNNAYLTGPYLDGTDKTDQSLFIFSKNQCRPECCPSTYACDKGCICTTENQRDFVSRRGMM